LGPICLIYFFSGLSANGTSEVLIEGTLKIAPIENTRTPDGSAIYRTALQIRIIAA
jgi:hypothetical protein